MSRGELVTRKPVLRDLGDSTSVPRPYEEAADPIRIWHLAKRVKLNLLGLVGEARRIRRHAEQEPRPNQVSKRAGE